MTAVRVAEELVERLVEYRRVKELAAMLHDQDVVRRCVWAPELVAELAAVEPGVDWEDVALGLLGRLYLDAMQRFEAAHPPPLQVLPLRFRVEDKMRNLYERVHEEGMVALLRELHTRPEVQEVVTIIVAVLELVRLGGVAAEQRRQFAEIYLRPGSRALDPRDLLIRGEDDAT